MKLLLALLSGAVFGAVNVIPGVSTGTMMVVFGCYDIVCGALALDFKHIKKHIAFLIPFGIGAVLGLGGAVLAISELIVQYPVPSYLFFMGLISGSFPLVFKNLQLKGKLKTLHIVLIIAAAALIIALGFVGRDAPGAPEFIAPGAPEFINERNAEGGVPYIIIIVSSFAAAAAMIIPGISGAFIFLLFGTYHIIMTALPAFDFGVIIPAVIGIAAGVVLGARGIKLLLAKFYTATYSVITGLVIGSVFAIFPEGVRLDATLAAGVCAFAAGAGITIFAGKANKEKQD
jgi:putative membrane protein